MKFSIIIVLLSSLLSVLAAITPEQIISNINEIASQVVIFRSHIKKLTPNNFIVANDIHNDARNLVSRTVDAAQDTKDFVLKGSSTDSAISPVTSLADLVTETLEDLKRQRFTFNKFLSPLTVLDAVRKDLNDVYDSHLKLLNPLIDGASPSTKPAYLEIAKRTNSAFDKAKIAYAA